MKYYKCPFCDIAPCLTEGDGIKPDLCVNPGEGPLPYDESIYPNREMDLKQFEYMYDIKEINGIGDFQLHNGILYKEKLKKLKELEEADADVTPEELWGSDNEMNTTTDGGKRTKRTKRSKRKQKRSKRIYYK